MCDNLVVLKDYKVFLFTPMDSKPDVSHRVYFLSPTDVVKRHLAYKIKSQQPRLGHRLFRLVYL